MSFGISLKRARDFDDLSEQPSQKWTRMDEPMALNPQIHFPVQLPLAPQTVQSRKKKREETFPDEMILDGLDPLPKKRVCSEDLRKATVQEKIPAQPPSRKTKRDTFFPDAMDLDDIKEPSAKRKREESPAEKTQAPAVGTNYFQEIPTAVHTKIIARPDIREDLPEGDAEKFYQITEKVDKSWRQITRNVRTRMGRDEEKEAYENEIRERQVLRAALEYAKNFGPKLTYANLSRYKDITDDQIEALVTFCPNIRVLILKDALISDFAFTHLSRLKKPGDLGNAVV